MKPLPFLPIAWTLAVSTAIFFAIDNLAAALLPNGWVMQRAWELVLPGFTFGTWGAFAVGLVESFVGGFLTAAILVPVYNFFAGRTRRSRCFSRPRGHGYASQPSQPMRCVPCGF